jgi:hypothetical protein
MTAAPFDRCEAGIREVINYDFPTSVQSYVHRIGEYWLPIGRQCIAELPFRPYRTRGP